MSDRRKHVRLAVAAGVASVVAAGAAITWGAGGSQADNPPPRERLACDGQRVVTDFDIDPNYKETRGPADQAAAFAVGPDGRRAAEAFGPLRARVSFAGQSRTEVSLQNAAGKTGAILQFSKINGSWRLVSSEACA